MRKWFRKKGEFFLLFFFFFIFYCFWQTKSIYGGDSGDLVTAAWAWGIPHPPGYPLYTLIASFLVHFLPFYTPAWRVGLISSFCSAATLAIFYLWLKKIIAGKTGRTGAARCAPAFALLGTLTLGFLYPFWLYSELAEVFALNNLFAVLLVYLFFNPGQAWKPQDRPGPKAFFFILGLSLAHHHTIVLLFPGFAYLIWKKKAIKTPRRWPNGLLRGGGKLFFLSLSLTRLPQNTLGLLE